MKIDYKGTLYIKAYGKYVPLAETVEHYENIEKENEQLKQKVERMKNHENCKHHSQYSRMHTVYADDKIVCYKCKNCSLWELAE